MDEDLSFNGDPELEHVDNTEKRAISYEHLAQHLEQQQQQPEEELQQIGEGEVEPLQHRQKLAWPEESENEVILPEFVQSYSHHHHPQQQYQQHQYLQQQQPQLLEFHSSAVDTAGYPHQPHTFLEQLVTGREELLPTSVHAQLPLNGDLSAFHALMAQTVPRNEFAPLQLLNPRDQVAASSHWSAEQQQQQQHSTTAVDYSSSSPQQLFPPPASLV